ncbi:hypothetical protein KUL113_63160 [Tenacibaculum sp. KUL113]|nr:hypothetical protein KUL113_63160 [Tenacibaculum sp. KUL113]
MVLSPLARLYMACAMLSLFSFSAFIASNSLLLLINYSGIAAILWIRLFSSRAHIGQLKRFAIARIIVTNFLFVTALTIGLLVSEDYKWWVVLAALIISSLSYLFPVYLNKPN